MDSFVHRTTRVSIIGENLRSNPVEHLGVPAEVAIAEPDVIEVEHLSNLPSPP